MSKQKKESIIDDLYYNLYGEHQTKEGQALEHLSAVALKLLEETRKVQYDQQIRAKYSDTVYQVDGLVSNGDQQMMVEAKDYTARGKKVGRADLQKLEGALTDLDIAEGIFVSATGYTNRAKPYAESTKVNPKQNPISLYHVRPSIPDDEKGRIKTIVVTIIANGLDFNRGTYKPIINDDFLKSIKDRIAKDGEKVIMTLSNFYDKEGNVVETFENITRQLNRDLPQKVNKGYILEGKWDFPIPVYISLGTFGDVMIDSIEYKIPTYRDECSFAINQDGNPVLLIKSEDGIINKLFTDKQLRQCSFGSGEIKK